MRLSFLFPSFVLFSWKGWHKVWKLFIRRHIRTKSCVIDIAPPPPNNKKKRRRVKWISRNTEHFHQTRDVANYWVKDICSSHQGILVCSYRSKDPYQRYQYNKSTPKNPKFQRNQWAKFKQELKHQYPKSSTLILC
jgi:hypothetical protein